MRSSFSIVAPRRVTTFGSAEFMNSKRMREKRESGRLAISERQGPFFGFYGEQTVRGRKLLSLFANDPGHILTVAPTRSGKGRCQIAPNLLSWAGSAVVLDVKGENFALTAGWRADHLGQRIIHLAPFERGGANWNPLRSIVALASGPDAVAKMEDAVTQLTELLFSPAPASSARDPFWTSTAKSVVTGVLMHVCTASLTPKGGPRSGVRERTVAEVRRLLTLPADLKRPDPNKPPALGDFQKMLGDMKFSENIWVSECADIIYTTMHSDKQWTGILTEAIDQLKVWSYSRVKKSTATSDFSFSDIRENTTVYISIPPEFITAYRGFLRVVMGCAMRELKDSSTQEHGEKDVLMILDEFPLLQNMQPIEDSLAYIAGYGVKYWFFVQDIAQLQRHYPDSWRSFIAGCGVRSFFGVSDYETAKLVSDMSGQSTVANETRGVSESRSQSKSYSESQSIGKTESRSVGGSSGQGGGGSNWSNGQSTTVTDTSGTTDTYGVTAGSSLSVTHAARALITPDEVMRLNAFEQIVFLKGEAPIRAWMLPYDMNIRLSARCVPVPVEWLPPSQASKPRPGAIPALVGPVETDGYAKDILF